MSTRDVYIGEAGESCRPDLTWPETKEEVKEAAIGGGGGHSSPSFPHYRANRTRRVINRLNGYKSLNQGQGYLHDSTPSTERLSLPCKPGQSSSLSSLPPSLPYLPYLTSLPFFPYKPVEPSSLTFPLPYRPPSLPSLPPLLFLSAFSTAFLPPGNLRRLLPSPNFTLWPAYSASFLSSIHCHSAFSFFNPLTTFPAYLLPLSSANLSCS